MEAEIGSVFPTPEDRDAVMAMLKSHNVAMVEVSFSGGGDSGDITSVDFISNEKDPEHTWRPGRCLEIGDVPFPNGWETYSNYNTEARAWESGMRRVEMPLEQLFRNIAYDALQGCGLDWYNNDGGQGTFTVSFDEHGEPMVALNIGINYSQTEDYEFKVAI